MDPAIIAAIIVATLGIIGIAFKYWLDKRAERRTRNLQDEEAQKQKVTEILSACNRGAIFASMHEQQNTAAMLAALASCRSTLQRELPSIRSKDLQKIVKEIIHEIKSIERYRKNALKKGNSEIAVHQ